MDSSVVHPLFRVFGVFRGDTSFVDLEPFDTAAAAAAVFHRSVLGHDQKKLLLNVDVAVIDDAEIHPGKRIHIE